MKLIKITWNEYQDMINKLVKQIKGNFDGIYGVPRGGLPIAVSLSHKLNIPLLLHPTENSLVVDDISDTGKTLSSHKNKKIAVLFNTKWTKTNPDFYIDWKNDKDSWIIFPWELNENERQTNLEEFKK